MSAFAFRFDASRVWAGVMIGLLLLMSLGVATGYAIIPLIALATLFIILWSYRYIYVALYTGIFFTPFLGIFLSVPTGDFAFGTRAFAGSIDVTLGEALLLCVCLAWFAKLAWLWWRRNDHNWAPRWPLLWAYLPFVGAHLASMASPLLPDPLVVTKFAMRPVLLSYVAYVALPANLIRSKRRLVAALGTFACIGTIAALNGLVAMFFPDAGGVIGRAHPMQIFGMPVLGENHNALAQLLVATAPVALAASLITTTPRLRRLLVGCAVFQCVMGLLTFTRTAWIAFAAEGIFLALTIWRVRIKRHLSSIAIVALCVLPFAIGMVFYTLSDTAQSSNSTRLMLAQIALQVFQSSPIFGGGAGSFVDRIGSTQIFVIEYGDPLDSHGFLQKLAAETGLLGLIAFCIFAASAIRFVARPLIRIRYLPYRDAAYLLVASAEGALIYQLFNTSYWTGILWLPLGLLVSALAIFDEPDTLSS